jgi:hypothetical protein
MSNKYNFNNNLLKASISDNIEDAHKEWQVICTHDRNDTDAHCICGHVVKNVKYMYNIKNKKTIIVGCVCFKKFNLNNKKLSNKIFKNVLQKVLQKGEYKNIDDIDQYCENIKIELINHFKDRLDELKLINSNNKADLLCQLKKEVDIIIQDYDINYLNNE